MAENATISPQLFGRVSNSFNELKIKAMPIGKKRPEGCCLE
jgi:hypothetical protein